MQIKYTSILKRLMEEKGAVNKSSVISSWATKRGWSVQRSGTQYCLQYEADVALLKIITDTENEKFNT